VKNSRTIVHKRTLIINGINCNHSTAEKTNQYLVLQKIRTTQKIYTEQPL